MNIGEQIKALRKKNNLTQEGLSELLCVSCQAVSKWECGVSCPDLSLIPALTKLFHVTADELLGLDQIHMEEKQKRFDEQYYELGSGDDLQRSYEMAKEAVVEFPENYRYLEWLARAEYRLAFVENQKNHPCDEFFDEMMDNCLRRYERIIDNCQEREVCSKAILGKIIALYFLDRIIEADWSAEFEYPDVHISSAKQALLLCEDGRVRLKYLEDEQTN